MVDLHCHILPGVDDGPREPGESLRMAETARKLGVKTVFATAHALSPRSTPPRERLEELAGGLSEETGLNVIPGYEVHYLALMEGLDPRGLTLGDTRVLLFELPMGQMPPRLHETVYELLGMGLVPVLAHPERYLYLKIEQLAQMRLWGLKFQGNLLSLVGAYGRKIRARARTMLQRGLFDVLATDAHTPEDYLAVKALIDRLPEELPWT